MSKFKILNAEEILSAADLEEKIVEVPQWGGAVKIRGLTKAQQQHIRRAAMVGDSIDTDRLEMLMFIHCVVEPKFTEGQYDALRQKSAGAIDTVLNAIFELSGFTGAAFAQAEKTFRPGV